MAAVQPFKQHSEEYYHCFAQHYKIIAVELQAHGHTADRNAPETFEQDADDVATLY